MKIYVICDLEGVAGVIDHKRQCWFNGKYYEQARRLATLELNSLVEGVLEAGATEIIAWDGHGPFPGGLDVELLHPKCRLIMGVGDGGPVGLDDSFDAMFQCGLHAMVGVKGGVLNHSFMPHIAACCLNDLKIGEIGMNCAVVGGFGIPSVFLSGDRAAAEEAKTLVPDIEVAIVKEGLSQAVTGLSPSSAFSLSPDKAREVIRESAKRAMAKIGSIAPFRVETPYTLRIEFTNEKYADESAARPEVKRIDSTTVEVKSDNLLALEF